MWFFAAASLLVTHFVAGAVAHGQGGWDWVHALPGCWEECLRGTSDGCDSKSCICESSQHAEYLTTAVECAVQSCGADGLQVGLTFLAPLQMYCAATGNDIPGSIMKSAYTCATATAGAPSPSPTRKVEHSLSSHGGAHQTRKEASNELQSTITSTVTLTTTSGDGDTLQVLIPIVMGPSTMTTGEMITSTLDSKPTASPAATSTPEPAAPAPTQMQDAPSSSAEPQATNIGGGSPFDLAQGKAAQWSSSRGVIIGAGLVVGMFMRL